MPLFEVAVVEMPSKKQEEEGAIETLVLPPTAVIARDAQSAGIVALRLNPGVAFDPAKSKVLIRPFV